MLRVFVFLRFIVHYFIIKQALQGAPLPPDLSLSPRSALPPAMSLAPSKIAKTDAGVGALDLQASIATFKKQGSSLMNVDSRVLSKFADDDGALADRNAPAGGDNNNAAVTAQSIAT
jgi:hypothetical protein